MIDPHRSKTAERSDWWVPVRPGTDAALALGMMHVLFRDGLDDQDLVGIVTVLAAMNFGTACCPNMILLVFRGLRMSR